MISRFLSFAGRYPLTPGLITVMGIVLIAEIYIARISESLFEFLFVASMELTPGILLAPVSHGSVVLHFLPNMALFLLCGWATETEMDSREFLRFTAVAAYLPTILQVFYSAIQSGEAATLGFSGAAYAFPPAYALLSLRDSEGTKLDRSQELQLIAIGISLAIPLTILGYLGIVSGGHSSAKITHSAGFIIGLAYGAWKYYRSESMTH